MKIIDERIMASLRPKGSVCDGKSGSVFHALVTRANSFCATITNLKLFLRTGKKIDQQSSNATTSLQ